MKVLQLGKFYPIRGGVEKVMWYLTQGLGEAGVECDMLCAKLPADGVDFKDRLLADRGAAETESGEFPGGSLVLRFNDKSRVICVPAKKKVSATMISRAMVSTLKKMLRKAEAEGAPYDIVHVHHPDPMAALALRLSGFKGKVVLHWHSDIVKQKTLLRFFMPLQNWLVRRADVVVGTSPVYVAESPHLTAAQDKLACLPIGTLPLAPDPEAVARLKAGFPGKKIVYSLGRLVEYKGYKYLVEAAKYLPDDYQVVIGGKGPLHTELEDEAHELGVSGKVTFLGWVPDEDSAAWFGACDIFALSSIMKTEAFAIVQVEAMSCGKPVVATRIPGSGVSWVNSDGESGINVPVEDAKALADAIVRITSDDAVYAGFAERARKRYETMFTYPEMIRGCKEIYGKLL